MCDRNEGCDGVACTAATGGEGRRGQKRGREVIQNMCAASLICAT